MRRKCDKCGVVSGNIVVSKDGVICWDCHKGVVRVGRKCELCRGEMDNVNSRICDSCYEMERISRGHFDRRESDELIVSRKKGE